MVMLSRKNLMIAGIIIIAALVVTGGIPVLLSVTVETSGVGYEYRDVTGGSDANGGGDLLNAPAYVTSWTGGGEGELIVLEGHYKNTAGVDFTPDFNFYWYEVTLNVDNPDVLINGVKGTSWTSSNFDAHLDWDYWIPAEAITLRLTNPCSGSIHVEMWGEVKDLNPLSDNYGLLAVDAAYLRSGIGKVQCTEDVVEENTQAKIYVETGYSHSAIAEVPDSNEGWFLQIFDLDNGALMYQTTVADLFTGYKYWLVPEGAYSPSSTNKMKVILRNELIDQDDDDLFVVGVGMIDDIPSLPTFRITDGDAPFTPGESITVKVSAEKTTYDIAGFWVSVSYETSAGTTTEYVIRDKWYAATVTADGGYCSVTFTFPSTGYVRMEASAADIMNLNSGNAEMTWTIYSDDGGTDPPLGVEDIDWNALIVAIILLAGAWIVYAKAPLPEFYRMILALLLVVAAAYFVMQAFGI